MQASIKAALHDCRYTRRKAIFRQALGDDRACRDNTTCAYFDAGQNSGTRANPAAMADLDRSSGAWPSSSLGGASTMTAGNKRHFWTDIAVIADIDRCFPMAVKFTFGAEPRIDPDPDLSVAVNPAPAAHARVGRHVNARHSKKQTPKREPPRRGQTKEQQVNNMADHAAGARLL